jgi:hypothetical protein
VVVVVVVDELADEKPGRAGSEVNRSGNTGAYWGSPRTVDI